MGLAKNNDPNLTTIGTADNNRGLGIFICKDAFYAYGSQQKHYSAHPLLMPDMQQTYPAGFLEPALVGQNRASYKIGRIRNPTEIALIWDGNQRMDNGNAWAVALNLDNNRVSNAGVPIPPGETFLLIDSGADLSQSVDGGPNVDSPTSTVAGTDPLRKWCNVRWRHSGNTMANFLFVDGHAAGLRYNSQ